MRFAVRVSFCEAPACDPITKKQVADPQLARASDADRKSTRLNSSHGYISYAVFCLKKKKSKQIKGGPSVVSTSPAALPGPGCPLGDSPSSPAEIRHALAYGPGICLLTLLRRGLLPD